LQVGVLVLLMAGWRVADLAFAQSLADRLIADFHDSERGGFYFTPQDHEALLYRPKPFSDEALPSGNAAAAAGLLRLGHLLAEPRLEAIAQATIKAGGSDIARYASVHAALLEALEDTLSPPPLIILRGEGAALQDWHRRAQMAFAPRRSVFAIPHDARNLPSGLAARTPRGPVVAYLCQGFQCAAPITDDTAYNEMLQQTAAPQSSPIRDPRT
jgi:uncharacterized protein YyaL (SSP411 family)